MTRSFLILFLPAILLSNFSYAAADDFTDSQLNEVGERRWECPASNWGKAKLEWPENKKNIVTRVSQNTNQFNPATNYNPDTRYRKLGLSVGRFEALWRKEGTTESLMTVCTASIIQGDHIITNRHCVTDDTGDTVLIAAQIRMGYLSDEIPGTVYKVEIQSIDISKALDFAFLGVYGFPFAQYGKVPFRPRDPKPGEELYIVHHPAGLPQKVTTGCHAQEAVTSDDSTSFHHSCATVGGSSGSLIFSAEDDAVVGLHYASIRPEFEHTLTAPFYKFSKRPFRIARESGPIQSVLPSLQENANPNVWLAVGSSGLTNVKQRWQSKPGLSTLLAYIQKNCEEGYSVHSVARSEKQGVWAVIMNEGRKDQAVHYFAPWADMASWIEARQAEGYRVDSLLYGEGGYLAVVTRREPEKRYSQDIRSYAEFPLAEIESLQRDGWLIQDILHDGTTEQPWTIVYSQQPSRQWTWRTGSTWPTEKINQVMAQNYRIDNARFVGGNWIVLLSRYNTNVQAPWGTRAYFPDVFVRSLWNAGLGVFLLVPEG